MLEKPHKEDGPATHDNSTQIALAGETSPGVRRIEALTKHFTPFDRCLLLFSAFLVAYSYSLHFTLSNVYTPYATANFRHHSLLATVNVLQAVISAAAQPTAAKIADSFGRVELVLVSIVFYVGGTIVEASSNGVNSFAAGAVLYQIGHICIILAVYIIIADTTSLRSRLFCSYIPALPSIINTWVSGDVSSAVLSATTWRWGIGMWAIIYPVCAVPLLFSLWVAYRRAKKAAGPADHKGPYQLLGASRFFTTLFWQLDVIGVVLLITVFALILVPFTIASGEPAQWKTTRIITPLIIGVLSFPIWVYWESRCKHPMIPFSLLKDRTVWGAFGIAVIFEATWYLQSSFLYTFLVVVVNESIKSATRIATVYTFCCVITGSIIGVVVFRVRRLKLLIIFGTTLYLAAFGILIYVRGSISLSTPFRVIASQAFLGIAGGMFIYPTQVNVQAATKHEHVAVITSLFFASNNIGGALGNAIAGAIWNQVLPSRLAFNLGNATEALAVFTNPFTYATRYRPGTPQRNAIVVSYGYVQNLICIVGVCLCILQIAFACVIRNPKLGNQQSLPDAECNKEEPESEAKSPWYTRFFN